MLLNGNNYFCLLIAEWSPGYEDFLNFIGETIRLLNWDKYRAGLDVKSK